MIKVNRTPALLKFKNSNVLRLPRSQCSISSLEYTQYVMRMQHSSQNVTALSGSTPHGGKAPSMQSFARKMQAYRAEGSACETSESCDSRLKGGGLVLCGMCHDLDLDGCSVPCSDATPSRGSERRDVSTSSSHPE